MLYERKEFTLKNGLQIVLKTPEIAEAAELLAFATNIAGQTAFLLSSPEDMQSYTIEKEEAFIEKHIHSRNYLIATYANGKIVGDCNLNFNTHLKDRHRCSVGIGIDKAYWGMGIASLLFDEMIRLAKETGGIEQMELDVLADNERAIRLYHKKGFVEVGRIPKAFRQKDGSYTDDIMMVKTLCDF